MKPVLALVVPKVIGRRLVLKVWGQATLTRKLKQNQSKENTWGKIES